MQPRRSVRPFGFQNQEVTTTAAADWPVKEDIFGVLTGSNYLKHSSMIPESGERRNRINEGAPRGTPEDPEAQNRPVVNPDGLIIPRKPQNPCVESKDHKNLHRELLFNQKIGKNVLNQKSELQRALEKHKDHQVRKELEENKEETPLEKVIQERARRLENLNDQVEEKKPVNGEPEFFKVHAKLRARMDSK